MIYRYEGETWRFCEQDKHVWVDVPEKHGALGYLPIYNWLVVEPTYLKHISQIESLPQEGIKINMFETTS